jgi:hypothetical protein
MLVGGEFADMLPKRARKEKKKKKRKFMLPERGVKTAG